MGLDLGPLGPSMAAQNLKQPNSWAKQANMTIYPSVPNKFCHLLSAQRYEGVGKT